MPRYIDADALPIVTECCVDEAGFFAKFKVVHEDDIKNAPTIEARPVVRGEWEEYQVPHIMCCSECDWGTEVQSDFNFCPNCGAEMRKGEE